MTYQRKLALTAGFSYLVIFFAAIFANFFALEALIQNPLETIQTQGLIVRIGIICFMVTVVFDVVVAWALQELYKSHYLSSLSTVFRLMHAAIMGVAIFALPLTLRMQEASEILHQIDIFNTIWLLGLFFFGIHLILLGLILQKPKALTTLLILAGIMYIVDTGAHFLMPNYEVYSTLFLTLVAVPSIVGEMSFSIWLLVKGGKNT